MTLLEEFKEYLRIDGNDENTTLLSFLSTAQLVLQNAGVKQPSDYYAVVNGVDIFSQHRLAVMMLATHYYENRIAVTNIKNELPYGVQTMILQLKWVDPVELSVQ